MTTEPQPELTYDAAFAELQSIVQEMENSVIQLDTFTAKTARADYLFRFCKERLRDTEARFDTYLKGWE
jgi:exodeoxyribonuclease VII small subunit